MNNPANQQIQVLKTVAKWADRFTCIRKIHVFGSFARCEAFSDVDIAVEYTTKDPSPECYTAVNTCSGELVRCRSRELWSMSAIVSFTEVTTNPYASSARLRECPGCC